ncbi:MULTISPECIES: hypothetical protein [unclassified Variovorax]|uniref:hypothetical protein n=1 Tax=unclassified Variovorax TaxID=663243 RepID=UPI002B23E657|nr:MULTISPECIES: hypothetical protein [unclassified Variovorax]MEB0058421.1 hypothetical protein [Variovorax sp. LG9.2]MEB0111809.1 hypothetical protein [Variovorax sp. RTB1]
MVATASPASSAAPRHWLIPYAGRNSPACIAALTGLRLPNLEALLARATLADDDTQADTTRSPPHERALAQALGLASEDGCIPWAALEARRSKVAEADDAEAWGWATLCHWQVGIDDVVLGDPAAIEIDAAESDALLKAAQPFFEEDGIALRGSAVPGRWLARGAVFQGIATASIDRAIGWPISQWSPLSDHARSLRRLQNEMQMLLYTQRVNDDRAARGVPPINSFWLSGTGALPPNLLPFDVDAPDVIGTLRPAALRDDGAAWADAWRALDAGPIAEALAAATRGDDVTLTLCGDLAAKRFTTHKRTFGRWLKGLFERPSATTLLATL